jgi:hypothetical protein
METIEDRIEYIRELRGCKNRTINGTVSLFCGGWNCYDPIEERCDIRDAAILALNEDAWDKEHEYLDPHPQGEWD